MTGNAFAIVFFFIFVGAKFMNPGFLMKWGYFLALFGIQLATILFFGPANGIIEIAPLICCVALSFLINMKQKNYIKSFNIAFSILFALMIIVYVIGTFIAVAFPNFHSLDGFGFNAVVAIGVFASAFALGKYKNFFFSQIADKKILVFHLLLKLFTFIFMGIVLSILAENISNAIYPLMLAVAGILVVIFFISKYNSKLLLKLENEKNMTIARNIEAETITKKHNDIVRLKHYYTGLFRSSLIYIEADDMVGMKNYYNERIAPINENLNKELSDYKQIELMKVNVIKARLFELVNTVSLIPNAKLTIHINGVVDYIAMKDIDLFAIINIYFENAVEEIREQEKGEIKVEITKTDKSVKFIISNSLVGKSSSLKPEGFRRGRQIAREIFEGYPNTQVRLQADYGIYEQVVEVFNDSKDCN